ncbi:universal stress protein [Sedimentibacter sp.]|uniref:universal stress protein n=1 Tax=Sedimentibacter sp. TaxID=1960295 RepID=UPI00289A9F09|nr:universal stress protein [Sedimentibacter sp.]
MKRLLIPVDGSNASIAAVKKAIEIARSNNSYVKLISVVKSSENKRKERNENLWNAVDGSIIVNEELEKKLESNYVENSEKLLSQIISRLDFNGIRVETEVLVGEPYLKIIEQAKNGNFDLIIMGSRGFSKVKRFFVGSVTQRVIAEAPSPVLVIRSAFEP